MVYRQQMAWALGREKAPLVLKNARLVNVLSGEIYSTDIAIGDKIILGLGQYEGLREMDLEGRYVYPGLIDGHVHLESSMVCPGEYAKAVLLRGTTCVIADPHELANVWGTAGIVFFLKATENLPLKVFFTLPSCVPATDLEDGGARLDAKDLWPFFEHPRVLGLGELMNVPGVLTSSPEVWDKIDVARRFNKLIDGHAPGYQGKELGAYVMAGVSSDHECITTEEAREKVRLGMQIMVREGSATKNLLDLIPAINPYNVSSFSLVTDDRHPEDLLDEGHLDHMLRLLIKAEMDPITALQMATINTARYFRLGTLGAIVPGFRADLVVAENLEDFKPYAVFADGELVVEEGQLTQSFPPRVPPSIPRKFNMAPIKKEQLKIPGREGSQARVIGLIPHQILTEKLLLDLPLIEGYWEAQEELDIAKLMVAERHHRTGTVGVGLVQGFGLWEGALASSVAHDSHNLVVIGMNDEDMLLAANLVAELDGGLAIVAQGKILGTLPLPVGGLLSLEPIEDVAAKLKELRQLAAQLGVKEEYDPFMTLSFLSLPVVPELKLTNRGLVHVAQHKIVPVAK